MSHHRLRRSHANKADYPFVFTGSQRPKGYKGQRCKILEGKKREVCVVEFQSGGKFHVQRSMVKAAT